jgi:outer membrane receptor protein involved in Fe transport
MTRFRVFWSLLALLLAAASLNAQVNGTVTGTVMDSSGAAIPDAEVHLNLPGSATAVFGTKTTPAGSFSILSVPANTYDMVIEAKGFQKSVRTGIEVLPGRSFDVPAIKLEVAGITQTVEVVDVGTNVQTSNSEVSTTIAKSQIAELPVADRSPLAFLSTQAGVGSNGTGQTIVDGQRPTYTNVTMDGINIQDNFIRTNDMDFLPNLLLLDQVSEVTLSTSNASAANYGGASQVAFVTPQGGNQFHGGVFWQNRNNYFRANSFYNNASGVPVSFMNLNQMGGKIGGPVKKNKLFFYVDYEAYRQHQQTTQNYTILTSDARNGIYTYKDTAGTVHKVNILQAMGLPASSVMSSYLALVPTPDKINNFNVGDSTSALLRNTGGDLAKRRDNRLRDNVTARGDYVFSDKSSFAVTYMQNRDNLDRPDEDLTYSVAPQQANSDTTKFLSTSWRFNPKPTITNEMRFGFNWAPAIFLDTQTTPNYFITGTTYTNPIGGGASGGGVLRTQGRNTDTYHYSDNASWVHGAHTIQFGFQTQVTHIETFNDAGITPSYGLGLGTNTAGLSGTQMPGASSTDLSAANALLSTLAGLYSSYTQTFNVSSRTSGYVNNYTQLRHLIQDNYAAYAQDTWKLARNLTANLGVRWDYYAPTTERDGLYLAPVITNNNPIATVFNPNTVLDFAGTSGGQPLWNASKKHFAPNVGLAWDPTGEGKWAIRAGYSIAFVNDNIVRAADNSLGTNAGLSSGSTKSGLDGNFASSLVPVAIPTFKVPRTLADNYALNSQAALAFPNPGLTTPYVQQWNISVQRSIKNTLLDVRYVGNHGTKEIRAFDYNQVQIGQLLQPFLQAANNGWLAKAANGSFNAVYNSAIPGSVPTPFFNAMPNGGYLTNSSVSSYLQTGQVGELGNFYQINGVNGPYNFYANPNILGGNVMTNYSNSTYNALQVDARHNLTHGLQFQVNYTFSKVLSDANGDQQTDFEPFLDINNTKIERHRVPGMDLTHAIKANFVYSLPFGHNRLFDVQNRILSKIVSGWDVSGIYTKQSGAPFGVTSAGRGTLNRAARSTNNMANTSLTAGQLDSMFKVYTRGDGMWFFPFANKNPTDLRAVAPDGSTPFSGQVFFEPGAGTIGSMQRDLFNGPWVWTMDAAVQKVTHITETKTLTFRATGVNVFNHLTWWLGDMSVQSTTFGKLTSQFYGNREMQFDLRLAF